MNAPTKPGLHPRNRHNQGYDFAALCAVAPELAAHVITTPAGTPSIDFAQPKAVKALNRALLETAYGVRNWTIPPGYLCPPIPGRADQIHHLADLLGEERRGDIPRGPGLHVLDIGVGANGVYPLIGQAEYGWQFVGVDTDPTALDNVKRILAANPALGKTITLRLQPVAEHIFVGVLRSGEKFDLSLCNPPFHASPAEAQAAALRKQKHLGHGAPRGGAPRLNFGGQDNELWYPGGERGFVTRMIEESATIPKRCLWFSTLVSKAENLRHVEAALARVKPAATRILPMAQGHKQSRLVAWTFLSTKERSAWRKARWPAPAPVAAPANPGDATGETAGGAGNAGSGPDGASDQ